MGATNPSEWSGVFKVKTPAGVQSDVFCCIQIHSSGLWEDQSKRERSGSQEARTTSIARASGLGSQIFAAMANGYADEHYSRFQRT
jgi:hypothetical protein